MIVSHTAGRLRLREKSWRLKDFEGFCNKIQSLTGVENVQMNPKTKSVLIFYQPFAKTTAEKIINIAQQIKPELPKSLKTTAQLPKLKTEAPKLAREQAHARQRYRARINLAMLITLGASLFALTTKNTKLHAITGLGFSAVLLLHLVEHRRILKRQFFPR